jgi:hypothetical protein
MVQGLSEQFLKLALLRFLLSPLVVHLFLVSSYRKEESETENRFLRTQNV